MCAMKSQKVVFCDIFSQRISIYSYMLGHPCTCMNGLGRRIQNLLVPVTFNVFTHSIELEITITVIVSDSPTQGQQGAGHVSLVSESYRCYTT